MDKHKTFHLTARQAFGPYQRGDHIEDEAEVNRILGGELRVHCVKVAADVEKVEPKPEKEPGPVVFGAAEPKAFEPRK